MKNSRPSNSGLKSWPFIAFFFFALLLGLTFFARNKSATHTVVNGSVAKEPSGTATLSDSSVTDALKRNRLRNAQDPLSKFEYIYDKGPNGRALASMGQDKKFIPDTDVATGSDLWIRDENGNERQIAESVYRAKFSPDGNKIAYTTSDAVLHVEDLTGKKIAEVAGAYDPDWKGDSTAVTFAKVPEGAPAHMPEFLNLAVMDLATGKTKKLTDGQFDDVRPHFSPDNEWVLFVSGGRSGLASFWKVSANGGTPEQVTNLGLNEVNEKFIPTPYSRSGWSPDKRWFVYDFKSGDVEETWGLEFGPGGKLKQAKRIADGVDPRWQDGKTFTVQKHNGNQMELVQYTLP